MQTGNTSTMIFPVAHLISYLSQFMVLEPGDVITTGTPPGVGTARKPPVYPQGRATPCIWALRVSASSIRRSWRVPDGARPRKTRAAMSETAGRKGQWSDLEESALFFHRYPVPGKLEIQATKPLGNQRDLALAYSPGVAAPCLAIRDEPALAADYTARANLVAVVSNGTAVLGLGDIGPLAAKPVMEGKAVLFKKFAGIDVFDIEIDAPTVPRMVETVAALEPTFGGINLEDIKAPECFEVEEQLKARMAIPVFHDDQHGTAIIVAAAVLNGLDLAGKKHRRGQDRHLRRRRCGARLPQPAGLAGRQAREHLGDRPPRRRLPRPRRRDGPLEGRLRPGHRGAHAGRRDRRRRHLPRPVGRRRAEAGAARRHGATSR